MKGFVKTLLALSLCLTNIALPVMFAQDVANEEHLINTDEFSDVKAIDVSSQYSSETIENTLDYDEKTIWHSNWSDNSQTLPQYITYDLQKAYDLEAISFLPRQDGSINGDIVEMNVYAGMSKSQLTLVDTFEFEATSQGLIDRNEYKTALFNTTARYVKVEVTQSSADSTPNKFASMSEIRFYGTISSQQPEISEVDKNVLAQYIQDAEKLEQKDYTTVSWNIFQDGLNAAIEAYDKDEISQIDVDIAAGRLKDVMEQLVKVNDLNEATLINKKANDGVVAIATTSEYATNLKEHCLDYNVSTIWHTNYAERDRMLPQSITFDLGKSYDLTDITFLPRQDAGYNGDITELNLYVGDDLNDLIFIDRYTFEGTSQGLKGRNDFIRIITQATGRYVQIEALKSLASSTNNKHASMSEIRFYGTEANMEEALAKAKTELNETLALVAAMNQEDYSIYSWNELQTACEEAQTKMALEDVMPQELKNLNNAIKLKVNRLVERSALKPLLEQAIIKKEMTSDYTLESLTVLEVAYEEALTLYESTQDYNVANVNLAVNNLNTALKQLKEVLKAPQKVENLSARQTSYKDVTLTWDPVEKATAYDVYRKSYKENATFELLQTVKLPFAKVSGLMTGKTYTYYVVAKNSVGDANPSTKLTFKTTLTGKVKLTMEQVSNTKFKLSWNQIEGATRYIIYRKRNQDGYKKVLTLGKDETTYTTSSMVAGTYKFIVRAARYDSKDRVLSDKSNSVTGISTVKAPKITGTSLSKAMKISWDKVEGVQYYDVYVATSANGKYIKQANTSKTSCEIKSLSSGKTYYVKVIGYKTYNEVDVYSPTSNMISVKVK